MARRSEILLMSTILFIQRIIFLIILLVNHFVADPDQGNYPDNIRLWMSASGLLVHLLMIILMITTDKHFFLVIHSPIVILSYMTYLVNTKKTFNSE